MDMAMREITLVVFTAIAPAGAMGYIGMALAALCTKGADDSRALKHHLVVPLTFVLLGLIASATHLGTPANALFVLTGVGRSPLSNEVVSAAAFLVFSGVYWMASFGHGRRPFDRTWLALSIGAGLAFVFFVSRAYSVDTIPTWNMPAATATLWMCALSGGPAIALLGASWAKVELSKQLERLMVGVARGASLANVALLIAETALLKDIGNIMTTGAALVPALPMAIAAYAAISFAAVAASTATARLSRSTECPPEKSGAIKLLASKPQMGYAASTLLMLCACFIVRFSFYAMYMTSGV